MCLLAEWWLPGRSPHSHPRPTRQEAVDVTQPPSLVAYLSSCDLSGLDALRSTRESTISFSPFFFPQLVYNNVLSPFYTRVTTPPSFRQYFILRFFKTFLTRAYRSDDRSAKSKSVKSGGESFNHRFVAWVNDREREREEKKNYASSTRLKSPDPFVRKKNLFHVSLSLGKASVTKHSTSNAAHATISPHRFQLTPPRFTPLASTIVRRANRRRIADTHTHTHRDA